MKKYLTNQKTIKRLNQCVRVCRQTRFTNLSLSKPIRIIAMVCFVLMARQAAAFSGDLSDVVRIHENTVGMCDFSGTISTEATGWGKIGYIDSYQQVGSTVTYGIYATEATDPVISLRYANGTAATIGAQVRVNGSATGDDFSFATTTSWSSWEYRSRRIDLVAGYNTVTIAATTAEGLPHIDTIIFNGGSVLLGEHNCATQASSSSEAQVSSADSSSSVSSIASSESSSQISSSSDASISSESSSSTPSTASSAAPEFTGELTDIVRVHENTVGMCDFSGTISTEATGWGKIGYIDSYQQVGSTVTYGIYATEATDPVISLRYANGTAATIGAQVRINGSATGDDFSFATTTSWSSWEYRSRRIDLVAGYNTVTIAATTTEGLPHIDTIIFNGGSVLLGEHNCATQASSSSEAQVSSADSSASSSSIASSESSSQISSSSEASISSESSSSTPSTASSAAPEFTGELTDVVRIHENTVGMCDFSGTISTEATGWGKIGYIDSYQQAGSTVTYGIYATEATDPVISLRYANGTAATIGAQVRINGSATGDDFSFATTTNWSSWEYRSRRIDLVAGYNTVTIAATTVEGLPHIDTIIFNGGSVLLGEHNCATQGSGSSSSVAAQELSQGNIYFVHNDHLGTAQVITDNNQQVVWAANYEPFGAVTVTENTIDNDSRFPGQYYDAATGLYYNYFRDYDPEIGRYIQSDPIGLGDGVNTYAYVSGNPINRWDPYGLSEMEWALPVAGGLALADGPAPVGDLAAAILLGGALLYDWTNPAQHQEEAPGNPAQEQEKDREHKEYHRVCDENPPPNLDRCELMKWKINQLQQCINLREQWDAKWGGDHSSQINQKRRELKKWKTRLENSTCSDKDC